MKKRFPVYITFHNNQSPDGEERLKKAYGRLISLAVESLLSRPHIRRIRQFVSAKACIINDKSQAK